MINFSAQSTTKLTPTWPQALLPSATEFGPSTLPILAGKLPSSLRGSLYRNGPARLERNGQRMGHWFDGDGAILGISFTGTTATATYRYVKTSGYLEEEKAGKLLYGNYGMTPPLPWLQRFSKSIKNSANTSVLPVADKLLALWEGGHPYALDLQTLETLKQDNLGWLKKTWFYSAHPKIDRESGEIYNFGVSPGANSTLQLYRNNSKAELIKHRSFKLDGVPLIHDFVLAGPYLVFVIPPVKVENIWEVILQQKSYSDSLVWQTEKPTTILIFDRETLDLISQSEAEPWFQWHFGNGCVNETGLLVLNVLRYENFKTNQRLKEIAAGSLQTAAEGTLCQMKIEPKTGKLLETETLVSRSCEFPTVAPAEIGKPWRYTYLSLHRPDADTTHEIYGSLGKFDHHTGTLTEANLPKNHYPTEPIYANDTENPDKGWILTVVFNGAENRSEVWVFEASSLDDEPVCRLGLPGVVPMGFHGCWK
ncbi:MAG TPA: carotenoid oxygenase family protein [Halomicronema sp.]